MAKTLENAAYVPTPASTDTAATDNVAMLPIAIRLPPDLTNLTPKQRVVEMRNYRAGLLKDAKLLEAQAKAAGPERRDNSRTGIVLLTHLMLANPKLAGNKDTALKLARDNDVRSSTGEQGPVELGTVLAVCRDLRRYLPIMAGSAFAQISADDVAAWCAAYDSAPRPNRS